MLLVSCCCTSCAKTLSRLGSLINVARSSGGASATNLALCDHDDAVADLLDDFQHVRDVEDGFPLCRQEFKQVLEQPRRDDIESGERFVEDEQFGIVQQGGGDQHPLAHSLWSRKRWASIARTPDADSLSSRVALASMSCLAETTESADQLQVFQARQVAVKMGLFRARIRMRCGRQPCPFEHPGLQRALCPSFGRAFR